MPSNQEYLQGLLESQKLDDAQLKMLKNLREKIQNQLCDLEGNPIFYYAGSYAKRTMIKDSYDLDLVLYWPTDTNIPLKDIFQSVGDELKKHWNYVNQKTVAWNISFKGGFHIDIVPGRSLDANNKFANLYRTDTGTSLRTSLKVHIDTIRNSNRRDAIRLMKLWKFKNKLPFKTFVLEQMVIEGCTGKPTNEYEPQLQATLRYFYDNIVGAHIIDPANSNNIISETMSHGEKIAIQNAAKAAIDARTWPDVYE